MSISIRLQELLDAAGIAYEHHTHPNTYTAIQTAQAIHAPMGEVAKTVIVNADGLLRVAVLPADCRLDLHHLQFITRSQNIRLATEDELQKAFPECELGAMPPLGIDADLPVFCDTRLALSPSIEFNAGTHSDTLRIAFRDFKRLASPTMVDLVDHQWHPAA